MRNLRQTALKRVRGSCMEATDKGPRSHGVFCLIAYECDWSVLLLLHIESKDLFEAFRSANAVI
jgi:hypothetical protein